MSATVLRGLLWSTLLLFSNATLADQNLLSNGDFEKPGFSFTPDPYWMATNDYRYLNPGANEALADWIVADNGIGQRSFVYHQNRYPVASGNYGLALNEGSSVTTTFVTQAPGVLNLRLNMTWATGCHCFQPAPLKVIVDGQEIASFTGPGSDFHYSDMSHVYEASFTVGLGNHSITLANPQMIGDFREYRIDQVVLMAAPVPEPEMAVLMIAGLGFLGAVARRRKARISA